MDENTLREFKQQLLQLQDSLHEYEEKSAKDNAKTVELDQSRVGRLSRMDAMQAQQMALEIRRRRDQKRLKIEGALKRIESGDFGYCFICDEEIHTRRLTADPTRTRCVACMEKSE